MRVLLYTANYGGRDDARWVPVEQHGVDVDWRYYTDDPTFRAPAPWETVRQAPNPEMHPNLAAKWYKTHPDADGYDAAIWVDASMEITSSTFVRDAAHRLMVVSAPVCACAHPRRYCVFQEARASLGPEGLGRYDHLPVVEQMASYRAEGFPSGWGLWACGVVAWANDARATQLGHAWWDECVRWGYQDQLSFPVVAWRAGYRPGTFLVPLIERQVAGGLGNRWLTIHDHLPGTG